MTAPPPRTAPPAAAGASQGSEAAAGRRGADPNHVTVPTWRRRGGGAVVAAEGGAVLPGDGLRALPAPPCSPRPASRTLAPRACSCRGPWRRSWPRRRRSGPRTGSCGEPARWRWVSPAGPTRRAGSRRPARRCVPDPERGSVTAGCCGGESVGREPGGPGREGKWGKRSFGAEDSPGRCLLCSLLASVWTEGFGCAALGLLSRKLMTSFSNRKRAVWGPSRPDPPDLMGSDTFSPARGWAGRNCDAAPGRLWRPAELKHVFWTWQPGSKICGYKSILL